jgi:hypothetical protein
MVRGSQPRLTKAVEIVVVDDDETCPPLHPRTVLGQALEAAGVSATAVDAPSSGSTASVCVALFGELRGDRSDVAYRPETLAAVASVCDAATLQRRESLIVLFAPPALASQIRGNAPIVCAWSGDRCMQEAVARWISRPPS